ncbi:protein YgfX [Shewanella sp.]|uniref:protein YgfX n=1 Tax=Shewanella sp. TaxID=50422 RepID=UPI003A978CA7
MLLATFALWPDIDLWFYPYLKYLLLSLSSVLLVRQYFTVCRWQFCFTLDEYGRVLAADEQHWQLAERSWVSPWLVVCFLERDGRDIPLFCFADMLADDDYRSLCRLIINRRSQPQSG